MVPVMMNSSQSDVYNTTSGEEGDNCSTKFPRAVSYYHEYLRSDIVQAVFVSVCALLSVCTLVMYAREMCGRYFRYSDPDKRLRTMVLLGLYPMTSTMACFAILVPRSTPLTDVIATCYLSASLYVFVTILIQYYGNKETLVRTLSPEKISLATPPCCCCCRCLPDIRVTRRSVRVLKALVLQTALFQPVVTFTKAVVWSDDNRSITDNSPESPFFYMNLMSGVSTLLAIYGLSVLVKASDSYLVRHRIRLKFFLMQLVLIFSNLQGAIFTIVTRAGLPHCDGMLGTKVKSSLIHHELLILELFVLSLLASYVYRRAESHTISETKMDGALVEPHNQDDQRTPVSEIGKE